MNLRARLLTLLAFAVLGVAACRTPVPPQTGTGLGTVAFVDVNVVPMDSERVLERQTVLVREGRIAALGPAEGTAVPARALRVDGRGKYLVPGLADMHVHLEHLEKEDLLLFLANGVTTVRQMDGRPEHLRWRDEVARGEIPGPTLYSAGPLLDGKPPIWPDSQVVETVEQARDLVATQKAAGYDFVKVYERLTDETYDAIVDEAKRQGLRVVGHVPFRVGLERVLASGQASIEHLDGYLDVLEAADSPFRRRYHWRKRFFAVPVDAAKIQEVARATRAAGAWNTPTLVVNKVAVPLETLRSWLDHPEMRYVSPRARQIWDPEVNPETLELYRSLTAEDLQALEAGKGVSRALVKALRDAGAGLLLGTDTPNPFVIPGFAIHEELRNLVDAGLTPYEAIAAGTRSAAEFLNGADAFGTVRVGKRADLILVDENPLQDVAALTRRAGVMVRGHWMPESELRRKLEERAAALGTRPIDPPGGED